MLKELKSPQKGSSAWSRVSDSLQVAENCTVLHCTVLYCTVLYCTVLYCNAPRPPHRSITGTVPVLIAHSDTDVVPI